MTLIMDPQPGESVYDPTCGSGGLLLNCALHLKEEDKEYRTLKLYGQEINLITSAIARMNMFLHGIEEFQVVRGDTLAEPAFLENDELKKFDVILANPPYSIKSWNQTQFATDPYGRNLWGTPPPGCADYAFQQHIQKSLNEEKGRSISLWPHGVLFRDSEAHIRQKMLENDQVECVIGLGPNLFYNSPMEACLLITRTKKSPERKDKILFINAVHEVRQDKTIGLLDERHIAKIFNAYKNFESIDGFSVVKNIDDILEKKGNMAINQYVRFREELIDTSSFEDSFSKWGTSSKSLSTSMQELFNELS